MKESLDLNFGLIIAFLLPGFICLYGLTFSFIELAALADSTATESATFGTFLFAMLASLAIGLLVSAVRWLVIDSLLSWTGIKAPRLKFEELRKPESFTVFLACIDNHYRYYQYYANSFVAIVAALGCYLVVGAEWPSLGIVILCIVALVALFLGARDSRRSFINERVQFLA